MSPEDIWYVIYFSCIKPGSIYVPTQLYAYLKSTYKKYCCCFYSWPAVLSRWTSHLRVLPPGRMTPYHTCQSEQVMTATCAELSNVHGRVPLLSPLLLTSAWSCFRHFARASGNFHLVLVYKSSSSGVIFLGVAAFPGQCQEYLLQYLKNLYFSPWWPSV